MPNPAQTGVYAVFSSMIRPCAPYFPINLFPCKDIPRTFRKQDKQIDFFPRKPYLLAIEHLQMPFTSVK